jgi:hypothetical protein
MGFKPSKQLKQQAQVRRADIASIKDELALRRALSAHKPLMPSKRTAKHDKASLHKAKAWHCAPVAIGTILRATKASRITWI